MMRSKYLPIPLLLLSLVLLSLAPLFGCSAEEDSSCIGTEDCGSGLVCFSGVCQTVLCASNLECPADSICYIDEGECGRHECRTDADCFSNRRSPYCIENRCSRDEPPECEDRAACGDGEACIDSACVEVGLGRTCSTDEDCGNPQICDPNLGESGACVNACEDNSDCDGFDDLRACDTTSGFCEPVDCLNHSHCEESEECNDEYVCVLQRYDCDSGPCGPEGQCPEEYICSNEMCGLDCAVQEGRPFRTEPVDDACRCVQCITDINCNEAASEVCTPSKRCLFCENEGSAASECPEEQPFFSEGCCFECQDDTDCAADGLGSTCRNGRCVACDCNAGCVCPANSDCETQEDAVTGVCIAHEGAIGEDCTTQAECGETLACSYATGLCVALATGSFCGDAGCPEPARCGAVTNGALCYGCHDNDGCPDGQVCDIPTEWIGVYDGGRCFPE